MLGSLASHILSQVMSSKYGASFSSFLGANTQPGSSSSAVVLANANLSEVATSGDSAMGQSPSKNLLKEAVLYLGEKVTNIEGEAEDYVQKKVHEVKKDTFEKAKAILQD